MSNIFGLYSVCLCEPSITLKWICLILFKYLPSGKKKEQNLLFGGNNYSRKAHIQYQQLHLTLLPGANFDLEVIPGRCEFLSLFFHLERKLELQTLFSADVYTHFQEGGLVR